MRKELSKLQEQRLVFTGIFDRYGTKTNWHGFPEKTVLLKDIRNHDGRVVADHVWFNFTNQFKNLGDLTQGDKIEFHARVKEYTKGYVNYRRGIDEREIDYKLSHPTRVRKVA